MSRFLEVGFATDVGKMRQRNEDSYVAFVPESPRNNPSGLEGLLLVADGMGGERAGDRASQMAAQRLREWIRTGEYRTWPEYRGRRPVETALGHAVRRVSDEIFQIGEDEPDVRGLGSTVVLVAVLDGVVVVAHVGDSRCYRVRRGAVELLTCDHSWVERQVQAGLLSPADARVHPQRNILTRSLGDELTPDVDLRTDALYDGDLLVLCSDGLTGSVTDEEILDYSRRYENLQELAEALVALANEKDGSDNITVVTGRWHGEETMEFSALELADTQKLRSTVTSIRDADEDSEDSEIDKTQPFLRPMGKLDPELDDTQPIPRPDKLIREMAERKMQQARKAAEEAKGDSTEDS